MGTPEEPDALTPRQLAVVTLWDTWRDQEQLHTNGLLEPENDQRKELARRLDVLVPDGAWRGRAFDPETYTPPAKAPPPPSTQTGPVKVVTSGTRENVPQEDAPGAWETAALKASSAVLGPFKWMGAAVGQNIPLAEDFDASMPGREYGDNPQLGMEKMLAQREETGTREHPIAAGVGQMAGTTLRNLPVSLIPGGLAAQVATSVPVTAANLAWDAAGEDRDVGEALKDPAAYASGAAGATMGPAVSSLARRFGPAQVTAADMGVREAANIARAKAMGAGKAQLDRAARGKGYRHLLEGVETAEELGVKGTPKQSYEKALALKPGKGAELEALGAEASQKIAPVRNKQIKDWFLSKRDEALALAGEHGDPALTQLAQKWDDHAQTLATHTLEHETPRIPSYGRVQRGGGTRFDKASGKFVVEDAVANPDAHLPISPDTPARSPTSGQRPVVHEVADLAHPGVMKPDPVGKRTQQVPVLQETLAKDWNEVWKMRRHYDDLAKKAYEGTDTAAAEHAREVAGYLRGLMNDLADQVPGDLGARLRKANREYEAVSYGETFAENKLFDVTDPAQLGRDVSRGLQGAMAAKDPLLGLATGAASAASTLQRHRGADLNARRLRWAQRRIEDYMTKPGGGGRTAIPRAAAAAMAPSDAALREAILQERMRQEQEQ